MIRVNLTAGKRREAIGVVRIFLQAQVFRCAPHPRKFLSDVGESV